MSWAGQTTFNITFARGSFDRGSWRAIVFQLGMNLAFLVCVPPGKCMHGLGPHPTN